ncbi:MAG: SAP domain-containing protein [Deltaproteobacteria bacterium]|nr:SAP domain-containing protein [Deltaproteobacteria bacterium]
MAGSWVGVVDEKKRNFLDMTSLIRSIQRSEGNPDCFLKGQAECDRTDCSWRLYCMGKEPKL